MQSTRVLAALQRLRAAQAGVANIRRRYPILADQVTAP